MTRSRPILALSVALAAGSAQGADLRLLGGSYGSSGMGEEGPSPIFLAQASGRWVSAEVLGGPSAKRESGRGWVARGSVDVWAGSWVSLGVGLTHRDGGDWTKRPVWIRGGLGPRCARVVVEMTTGSANLERKVEGIVAWSRGRLTAEGRVYALKYRQGTGYGAMMALGWRIRR